MRRILIALLVAVLARGGAPLAQALQRSIYVSVVDDGGVPVSGLGPSDFTIREDSLPREILRVAPADAPMQVALLVDYSTAATGSIRDIREGVTEFLKAMSATGKHEVSLLGVAERPTILVDYTTNTARLLQGVGRIFPPPDSGARLLDGIIETSRGFRKRGATRPVIVAIATTGPELSDRSSDQVLSALSDGGAAFHLILLGPTPADLNTNQGRERAYVFTRGTEMSGGRYDNVLATSALPARMKQVADELTHQYLVTYARPQSLIPPERITVGATRSGLTARGTPVRNQRDGVRQ
jgi:hypothetical protein